MNKVLTLCEVAALAREITADLHRPTSLRRVMSVSQFGISRKDYDGMFRYSDDENSANSKNVKSIPSSYQGGFIVDPTNNDPRRGALDPSQKAKINELLGAW